jgi:hypothetical protein
VFSPQTAKLNEQQIKMGKTVLLGSDLPGKSGLKNN